MRPTLLLLPFALAACSAADAGGDSHGAGPRVGRDYALSGFDRVALKGSDDVEVRVGPGFKVHAEASRELLDRLEIVVENGTLKVGRRSDSWNWGGREDHARITVTLPKITGAVVAGSGDMTVDRVAGGDFEGTLSGSGDLSIGGVQVQAVKFNVAGSGDLKAAGRAARAEYSIAGSGGIDAANLSAQTLAASVAGSGDIGARATGTAKLSIVGSGDITVTGGAHCTISKVGSGDAKCG